MRQLKVISISLLILLYPYLVFTQNHPEGQDADTSLDDKELIENHPDKEIFQEKLDIRSNKPLNINFFTGTNYLFSRGIGSVGSIYFGTNAVYSVTPKFTIDFGAAVNFYQLTGLPSGFFPENNLSEPVLHTTSVTLYARGNYFLSSRLTLSGMVFKQFSPYAYPSVNPYFLNSNHQGMSLGMNYRLSQNFHIGAQFNFIQNDHPFYPSRLSQPVFDNYYW